jgi:hypothetical protein
MSIAAALACSGAVVLEWRISGVEVRRLDFGLFFFFEGNFGLLFAAVDSDDGHVQCKMGHQGGLISLNVLASPKRWAY